MSTSVASGRLIQEKRVSTDGYAYTRAEFLAHFGGAYEWNGAPVETRYDRDGNTYTQAAFFAHYGSLDEWYTARPANANIGQAASSSSSSSSSSSFSTFPAVDHATPGWSSDRGPTAPDHGFFDTRGYQEQFHSYDDMAYSPQVYGHWSAAAPPSSSSSHQQQQQQQQQHSLGNMSSRSEMSQNSHDYSQSSYHDASPAPSSSLRSSSRAMPRHAVRAARPGTSASVTRMRDAPLRGRHPMYRNGNSRHHAGLGGGRYASSAAPSAASFARNQSTSAIVGSSTSGSGSANIYRHTARSSNPSQAAGHPIERSLSSLGRKLFSHIPPNKNKHFFPPDSPKSSRRARDSGRRRRSAGEKLGALTPKNGRSPDRSRQGAGCGGDNATGNTIDIGDYISVRCNMSGRFRLCCVLDLRDGDPPTVHVHFEGTPAVPDELIRFDSDRLAPFDAQQSSANGGDTASSKKIIVANSKKVSVGDFAEVRIFYQDPTTKKGDFRWQMAQIVSLDSNDGSIRVHFEGLSDINIGDEIIPGPDVPLRVRAMSTGIASPTNSPKRIGKKTRNEEMVRKNSGDENESGGGDDGANVEVDGVEDDAHRNHTSGGSNNQSESDIDDSSSSDDSPGGGRKSKKMRESKSDIAKELRKRGLRVIKIAADGNCLFRAVCHQVYADVSRHLELRQRCCDYMASQEEHFSAFVEGGFDDYLEGMRDATTWGGNLEIEALQEMFDRKIQIHSNDDRGGYEATTIGGARNQSKTKPGVGIFSKSAPSLLPNLNREGSSSNSVEGSGGGGGGGGGDGGGDSSLKKMRSSSSMAALAKVPSFKIPVVLKHDFSSSSDTATPRPSSERVPEPIMLSYHGRSHYNSVINPKHPPPLRPLGTSYIRQGRILREQHATIKAANDGRLVESHSEGNSNDNMSRTKKGLGAGEKGLGARSDELTPNTKMKKKKKANRLAFFRFRKNKMGEDGGGGGVEDVAGNADQEGAAGAADTKSVSTLEQQTKRPPVLEPIRSAPYMIKLTTESSSVPGSNSAGSSSLSVLHARQERQRPSLPTLRGGVAENVAEVDAGAGGTDLEAMRRANQVLKAAQTHEKRLQSQGL